MIHLTRLFIAVAVLGVPVLCLAGRPVFNELSLRDLAESSTLIAVVAKATSETAARGVYGCESLEWRLPVVAIIKTSPRFDVRPGSTIDVRRNVTSYQDCVLRQGGKTSGASFGANRYRPSISDAPQQERFIVFLGPGDRTLELAAEGGFESIAERSRVERLVGGSNVAVDSDASGASDESLPELEPLSCKLESTLRSMSGVVPSAIQVRNEGNEPIELIWLDYEGKRKPYGPIAARSTREQRTFLTHPWVVVTSSGRCIAILMPRATRHRATVR